MTKSYYRGCVTPPRAARPQARASSRNASSSSSLVAVEVFASSRLTSLPRVPRALPPSVIVAQRRGGGAGVFHDGPRVVRGHLEVAPEGPGRVRPDRDVHMPEQDRPGGRRSRGGGAGGTRGLGGGAGGEALPRVRARRLQRRPRLPPPRAAVEPGPGAPGGRRRDRRGRDALGRRDAARAGGFASTPGTERTMEEMATPAHATRDDGGGGGGGGFGWQAAAVRSPAFSPGGGVHSGTPRRGAGAALAELLAEREPRRRRRASSGWGRARAERGEETTHREGHVQVRAGGDRARTEGTPRPSRRARAKNINSLR